MGSNLTIGIAEDYRLILDALCKLLEDEFEIVGSVLNGRDAVALAVEKRPQIMLMEITLAGMNGLDAARQIKRVDPSIKIIFVTSHTHAMFAKEAFEAGASGYVLKQSPSSELLAAIHTVVAGTFYISSILAERLRVPQTGEDPTTLDLFATLTTRQREVLQLIAEGNSRKEIAATLNVSMKTIEFHKNQLKKALNLKTTAALIRYALDSGLIPK